MSELLAHIKDIIEKSGPMPVASFMELALQHPEFGYYRNHDPLGADGDFVTAPEISQMFGEMIGLWCADVWQQMGKPSQFVLLEMGPGRGTLMQDALRATAKLQGFYEAMHLCFLESNQTLRKVQKEKLADHHPVYVDHIGDLPKLPTIIIANEFFDALPIRQFEKTFQGWYERLVSIEKGKLAFSFWPLDPNFAMLIPPELKEANPGTVYEASLPALVIMRDVAQHIVKQGGAALIIDYGYVEPSGKASLQAVSKHQFADILARPGEVDLTAHVNFGALKSTAQTQKASVLGPLGQGEFLQALGIELRAIQLKQRATPSQAKDIDSALHRLTDSSQMGTMFKAMAVASPNFTMLPGF